MSDLLNRVGRSAFSYLASGGGEGGSDEFVGSVVEVDTMQVQVTKLLGEGGYAFIYAAKEQTTGKEFALKRFLVFEESKVQEVVAEIRLIKELKNQGDLVTFVTAASVDHSQGRKVNKEFLLLMELCSGGDLAQLLRRVQAPLSPQNVCLVLACLARSLSALHARSPPVTHRDIKLENLLISSNGSVKLCDLGSATTSVHSPGPDWNMNQRTVLEDELAKYSTPMYRAPEMLDTWSNFPINQAVDIWAAGLVLYAVCFNKHPFEDSNKLAIVNGNYRIPSADSRYKTFHPLINAMLSLDPRARPTAPQLLDQVSTIAETHGWRTRGSLEDIALDPLPEQQPLPDGPTVVPSPTDPAAGNMNSIKASAGNLFSRLKASSSAMVASVQQSMVGRDLDFHCITSRLAAMSFPAEGIESAYRNHIEDVKAMMEAQYAGNYQVYNVSERSYPATKYPTGKLVHAPWPPGTVPPLDTTLDLCHSILEFLSKDLRHVAVVHCLDGKSSTAYLVCALLIYVRFVSSVEAAIAVFSGKRCDPVLTACQRASLSNLASLAASTPPVLKSPFVTLSSLVLEPIPLFNKAGDGCRPYVEVFQGKERVLSSLQDYARMKGYSITQGDEAAVLPVNITVCGDITVVVSHARQALGVLKPVKICQIQLHTSSLTPGRPSYSWELQQLDCLAEPARYSPSFRLVLNCNTAEECSGRDVAWAEASASMLLFNSDQDYEATIRLLPIAESDSSAEGLGQMRSVNPTCSGITQGQSTFYVNNPEIAPPLAADTLATDVAEATASVDLLGLGGVKEEKPEEELLPGFPSTTARDTSSPKPPVDSVNLLDPTPPPTGNSGTFSFLGDLGQPAPAPPQAQAVPQSDKISDLFGLPQADIAAPLLDMPRVTSSPNLKQDGNNFDPFSNLTGLSGSMSNHNLKTAPSTAPMRSMGGSQIRPPGPQAKQINQSPVDPFAGLGGIGSQQPPARPNPAPQPQQQMGPNYSRSFFSEKPAAPAPTGPRPAGPGAGVKPKADFGDLLGGFNPTAKDVNQGKTIGQMKKADLVKTMDPDEAKILDWKEGKSRNIRTLLCSLHKVIFPGTRWTECGMHQLVSAADVKKMYRKACLAVHPDKQTGTENENFSKLIFMELNEAWSEFDNDPSQQNMFS